MHFSRYIINNGIIFLRISRVFSSIFNKLLKGERQASSNVLLISKHSET